MDFSIYSWTFCGLWFVLLTVMVQGLVANVSKARLPDNIPGKLNDSLGHESFTFRAIRTLQNSLDNLAVFLGSAFLAILVGVAAKPLATVVWVYAIARLLHMLLYYFIATQKNPSPRSYFFLIATLANLVLLGQIIYQLAI